MRLVAFGHALSGPHSHGEYVWVSGAGGVGDVGGEAWLRSDSRVQAPQVCEVVERVSEADEVP